MLAIEKLDMFNELSVGTVSIIGMVPSSIGTGLLQHATEMMIGNQEKPIN
jgi:hypothetical protein